MLTRRENELLAGIAAVLAPDLPALAPGERVRVLSDVSAFLTAQVDGLPAVLRLPYRCALVAFDLTPLLSRGRSFRRLGAAERAAHLAWWTDAGGLATRNVVKLLRSCTLLAWFDHPLVTDHLLEVADRPEAAA